VAKIKKAVKLITKASIHKAIKKLTAGRKKASELTKLGKRKSKR